MATALNKSPLCKENRGTSLLVLSYTLLSLSVTAVALRIWFRRNLRHGISWDDYFIVASLVCPNFSLTLYIVKRNLYKFFPYENGACFREKLIVDRLMLSLV